ETAGLSRRRDYRHTAGAPASALRHRRVVMSVLGSAGKGAMSGASIGSIVPGIGTGIGAAIGGLAGLFGGMFGHHSQPKQTANGMPQGARLEDILPMLLPLLKQ